MRNWPFGTAFAPLTRFFYWLPRWDGMLRLHSYDHRNHQTAVGRGHRCVSSAFSHHDHAAGTSTGWILSQPRRSTSHAPQWRDRAQPLFHHRHLHRPDWIWTDLVLHLLSPALTLLIFNPSAWAESCQVSAWKRTAQSTARQSLPNQDIAPWRAFADQETISLQSRPRPCRWQPSKESNKLLVYFP